jgi:DNA mismatch endonuclease (patch repair protein)
MVDVLTKKQRQYCMSRIQGKDTKPEMVVRKLVFAMGYRYRLHDKKLPGKPDLVFAGRRKVIFVHGCFWHRHNCKYGRVVPQTRKPFWKEKLDKNKERDKKNIQKLKQMGWGVLVVWECETKNTERRELLINKLGIFLSS